MKIILVKEQDTLTPLERTKQQEKIDKKIELMKIKEDRKEDIANENTIYI